MIGAEVMFLIAHMQPVRSSDLAEVSGDSVSTLSNSLTRLWRRGLLVRKKDPETRVGGTRYVYALASFEEGEWA